MTDARLLPTSPPGSPQPRARRSRVPWALVLVAALVALLTGVLVWRLGHRERPAPEPPPAAALRRAGEEVAVVLDSAALQRAGIRTVALGTAVGAGEGAGTTPAPGQTLDARLGLTGELEVDPGRITTIRSALPGRLSAGSGHWPALGEYVAAGRVLAQVSDARPLVAPHGGVVTVISAQPGELVQAGQELLRLADLSVLLARVPWRPDAPPPPSSVRIVPMTTAPGAAGWRARLVGPAAEVDSLTRLSVYLYRLSGVAAGARPGLPITALLPEPFAEPLSAAGRAGVAPSSAAPADGARSALVPLDAVVQWQGLAWVYVQRAPGRFVRVRVDTSRPTAGGWRVAAASSPTPGTLAAGDAVVVRGAQQLLSAEFATQLPKDADER